MLRRKKDIRLNYAESGNVATITPFGDMILSNGSYYEFDEKVLSDKITGLILDLAQIEKYDSILVAFILQLKESANKKDIHFTYINASDELLKYIELLIPNQQFGDFKAEPDNSIKGMIINLGIGTKNLLSDIRDFVEFFGNLFIKIIKLPFKPLSIRWEDFPMQFFRSGVLAIPITVLIVFLIGLITGYQGAIQLKRFGADMFIADLIGISITRELSPLMVAILVAGRSGSAFAAELGSMKISDEINALTSMGYDKIEFLVLPRVLAVVLAMPFIVIICNLVGLLGGLIAALATLDVTVVSYVNRLEIALNYGDIASGLIKSLFFGFVISSIGCYKGLKVSGGADAVGRFTTSAVVAGVFMIILSDAIFTFIFQALGI